MTIELPERNRLTRARLAWACLCMSWSTGYSLTSPYRHLYDTDTSLLRRVRLVPEMQKYFIPYLYNTDTSVKRTLSSVPLVSVLKRFDCKGFE